MESLIHKKKQYFEKVYDGLRFHYTNADNPPKHTEMEKDDLWFVWIEVGKFNKGFRIKKGEEVKLVIKMFDALEKSLKYTAMYFFLKEGKKWKKQQK